MGESLADRVSVVQPAHFDFSIDGAASFPLYIDLFLDVLAVRLAWAAWGTKQTVPSSVPSTNGPDRYTHNDIVQYNGRNANQGSTPSRQSDYFEQRSSRAATPSYHGQTHSSQARRRTASPGAPRCAHIWPARYAEEATKLVLQRTRSASPSRASERRVITPRRNRQKHLPQLLPSEVLSIERAALARALDGAHSGSGQSSFSIIDRLKTSEARTEGGPSRSLEAATQAIADNAYLERVAAMRNTLASKPATAPLETTVSVSELTASKKESAKQNGLNKLHARSYPLYNTSESPPRSQDLSPQSIDGVEGEMSIPSAARKIGASSTALGSTGGRESDIFAGNMPTWRLAQKMQADELDSAIPAENGQSAAVLFEVQLDVGNTGVIPIRVHEGANVGAVAAGIAAEHGLKDSEEKRIARYLRQKRDDILKQMSSNGGK